MAELGNISVKLIGDKLAGTDMNGNAKSSAI